MDPELSEELNKIIDKYTELHEKGELSEGIPDKMKDQCIALVDSRIDVLVSKEDMGSPEFDECTLVSKALKNGWLVSDIPMLMSVYEAVRSLPFGERERTWGEQIISQIESTVTDKVADRFTMLKTLMFYMIECSTSTAETKKSYKAIRENYHPKIIYATEYPQDTEFGTYAMDDDGGKMKTSFTSIYNNAGQYKILTEYQDRNVRETDSYIMPLISQADRIKERKKGFVPNDGQKHNDIKKSNRDVISEVFGNDVYDEIDEMMTGSLEERTVPLYHSLGTKYQKQGHEVLEIGFAGSGAQDVVKNHKGRTGEIRNIADPEEYEKRYGKKVKKGKDRNGKDIYFDYIHTDENEYKLNDDLTVKKKRYNIAGATPNMGKISGLFNLGEYSIESSKIHARDFAKEFIEPLFERFRNGEDPREINIMLSGHSRGAVAAGQAVKKINEWVNKYIEEHPDCARFADYVKYDLLLYDPVPGAITDLHLGSCDLRGIKNVNTTIMCTMAQDHYDILLPLQHVKGAKKIILTTTDHLMDIWLEDKTQVNVLGDGKKHARGYYDAETGEMYRGSGLNELPDGVYFSDEKHNIVRITSYSQLSTIFGTLYGDVSPQRKRCNNIHKMVRDWFIENRLEMSFPDKETRLELTERNKDIEDRIINSPNKRLNAIKSEIDKLRKLKTGDATKENIVDQQTEIIKQCREYMKKTRIPASGDSLYRVNLVSDLLSFTMRESNELKKELSIEHGHEKESVLDDRIAKHKERLGEKEGYTRRKLYEEKNRLDNETAILDSVKATAKLCEEKLKVLDKTRVGKRTSEEYDDLHDVLKTGTKLGAKASVNEIVEFYKSLTRAADRYTLFHDTVFGPITKDGQKRLEISKDLSEHGKKVGKEIEDKAIKLRDKDMSMEKRILKRKEAVTKLTVKGDEQREVFKIERRQKVENAKKRVEADVVRSEHVRKI